MIVGAAGELPKPPAEPIKFLEDMDDTELADAVRLMSLIRFSDLIRALDWDARWSNEVRSNIRSTSSCHLILCIQLGKYLLYECDHSGSASNPGTADRPLRVCRLIPFCRLYLMLAVPSSRDTNPIARSLRELYTTMSRSTGGVMPLAFLTALRTAVPQFAERSTAGNGGFAQQGYSSILYSHL
jgi:ubiquitin carboxyl-terminal hydrolase 14